MRLKSASFILLFICLLNFWLPLQAQKSMADTDFYQHAQSWVTASYLKKMGLSSNLYLGAEYQHYWNRVKGNPFFLNENFQNGSVYYDRTFYDSVQLSYDMMKDQLVIQNEGIQFGIVLVSAKIDYFKIGSHYFKRLVFDSSRNNEMTTGFYEQLNSDKNVVYVKRVKQISQSSNASDDFSKFKEYETYWIEKADEFYQIDHESDLRRLFRVQWPLIRKYLNTQHVRFKIDPVQAILLTVKYDAQLQDDHAKTL